MGSVPNFRIAKAAACFYHQLELWLSVESAMRANRDFRDFFSILDEEGVEYLAIGEFAFFHYVEPRITKNLDIWINTSKENAEKTWNSLTKFGIPLMRAQLSDFTRPELGYQIGIKDIYIKVLGGVAGVSFSEAYTRAELTSYAGVPIRIISRQDLIASKRATRRKHDLLDAEQLDLSMK
jgi:hypothetical protein